MRAVPVGLNNPPVIIMAMEIFGLHEYVEDVTRRVAWLGALAIAPDYYFRGLGDMTKVTEMAQLLPQVNPKPDAELLADLDGAVVQWAKRQTADANRLGIIGFCRGGRTVWRCPAHSPQTQGRRRVLRTGGRPAWSAAMPKNATALAAQMKAPVLGLYGEADTGIPVATVEKLEANLQAAGKEIAEFKIYPGAPHGFHADYRPSYRKDAADDAWNEMQAWFKKYKVLG